MAGSQGVCVRTCQLSRVSSWKGRPVLGMWQQAPMKRTTLGCRLRRRCRSTSSLHAHNQLMKSCIYDSCLASRPLLL